MSDTSNKGTIPSDPHKNLERMKSITARWEKQLDRKDDVAKRTTARLARLNELIKADEEALARGDDIDTVEAETRKTIARKYVFELEGNPDSGVKGLNREIAELKSKIFWAKRQQIPFIESEIAALEAETDGTEETHDAEVQQEQADDEQDGTADHDTLNAAEA